MAKKKNTPKKVILVCGARPNFMKIAPLYKEMKKYPKHFKPIILHTGQHYDTNMSGQFFKDLELPKPDVYLEVGSGSHAEQTARIMERFEKAVLKIKPDLVVVVGDVNSTVACALVTSKLLIPLAHVEAGLRSFDRTMPEEINRIVTDALSDYLFVDEESGLVNLEKEGIPKEKIFFVGNIMIDSLVNFKKKSERSTILKRYDLKPKNYAVLTLHRPSNVDNKTILTGIADALKKISEHICIVFPAHPRTVKQLEKFKISIDPGKILITDPLGYLDFLKLYSNSRFVLTDSGGLQEETTYLNIPCLTIRENTERPATISEGTNILTGQDAVKIHMESIKIIKRAVVRGCVPSMWDGKTAKRIVNRFMCIFHGERKYANF